MKKITFVLALLMVSAAGIACADIAKVRADIEEAKKDQKNGVAEFKAIIEAAVARGDITVSEADQLIAEFCAI